MRDELLELQVHRFDCEARLRIAWLTNGESMESDRETGSDLLETKGASLERIFAPRIPKPPLGFVNRAP
jgi:hypothetical protein